MRFSKLRISKLDCLLYKLDIYGTLQPIICFDADDSMGSKIELSYLEMRLSIKFTLKPF